jgi:aminopeptidase N
LVGDEAFFLGLQRFYVETRFAKASTEDFRQAMESESGALARTILRELDLPADLPHLKLTYQLEAKAARTAIIRVEQTRPCSICPSR